MRSVSGNVLGLEQPTLVVLLAEHHPQASAVVEEVLRTLALGEVVVEAVVVHSYSCLFLVSSIECKSFGLFVLRFL